MVDASLSLRNENDSQEKQRAFVPPYCPNLECPFHSISNKPKTMGVRFFRSKGWARLNGFPDRDCPNLIRRYKCLHCRKSFRYSYFTLDYRQKKRGLSDRIFSLFLTGTTNREIGRQIGASEHLVRRRLTQLGQWGFLRHAEFLSKVSINEPIAYDGLQNFAKSQYDPNNIQQAIGSESLYIYDFNFAPLNRSGKMSPGQKHTRGYLDRTLGRYDPQAIRKSTAEILRRLHGKRGDPTKPLILYSDEHFQYRRAIERDLRDLTIFQVRISSKAARNFQNILFPVNHSDLLIRQHVGAFSRETISFSKTHERMIQKFLLFLIWMNYFRPQFVKKHRRRPNAHITTPAMHLGLTREPMKFNEFFDFRRTLKQVPLNPEWERFYHEKPTYSRRNLPRSL